MLPEHARCLGCGYRLRSLREFVCPECGRPFDPEDPRTFYTDPDRRRRFRRIRRTAVLITLGGLLFLLWPRGYSTYTLSFTCAQCGATAGAKRWELQSPRWVPLGYPSVSWPWGDPTPEPGACRHRYNIAVGWTDRLTGTGANGNGLEDATHDVFINDRRATPANAAAILKDVSKYRSFKIATMPTDSQEQAIPPASTSRPSEGG
jgi:predicted RNA-binding Zn-ribbon protein involved in translation (DUF1610 family)